MSFKIGEEKSRKLDEELIKRSVSYLSRETTDIKIRFTAKGLDLLKRNIYMRPHYFEVDPNDENIYTFRCTEVQAVNYFFKFGWEAFILEPDSLQNRIRTYYESAYNTYTGISKEEIIQNRVGSEK